MGEGEGTLFQCACGGVADVETTSGSFIAGAGAIEGEGDGEKGMLEKGDSAMEGT